MRPRANFVAHLMRLFSRVSNMTKPKVIRGGLACSLSVLMKTKCWRSLLRQELRLDRKVSFIPIEARIWLVWPMSWNRA